MAKYARAKQASYDRTIVVHVKPTNYPREGKATSRKGYTYRRKDVGRLGKGPRLIMIKRRGDLKKHGYNTKKGEAARHRALANAVQEYGALSVYRKLKAIATLQKRNPKIGGIFDVDAEWVKSQYKMNGFVS
jgi:hypothetical protein